MSNSPEAPSCALPPHLASWRSLVTRSIAAWDNLATTDQTIYKNTGIPRSILKECRTLDNFLKKSGDLLSFWFFQQRSAFMSQKHMKKWSRNELNDYILFPASPGFVSRSDCFFVSHFWQTQEDPDPDGEYLRLHQAEFEPQAWSYIWVDWTCMPQNPRLPREQVYFNRCLRTMSGIIRNCGFAYFYPPFKPRLWILYEITEYALTCSGKIAITPDIKLFLQHIDEMVTTSVQATLVKHVLLRRLDFNVYRIRKIMDNITWLKTLLMGRGIDSLNSHINNCEARSIRIIYSAHTKQSPPSLTSSQSTYPD
ncbi:hypothetical protein O988_08915 [Pseudogymnoascus sp. VKM F-3808]|nr:hypothetical protein O988_08915 [Pseudogymnoascus sp. VKM F-3808]